MNVTSKALMLVAAGMVAALSSNACTVKEADGAAGAGGASGANSAAGSSAAGAGGSSAGGASAAGAGGAAANPCGDVPTTGQCVDKQTIRTCQVSEVSGAAPKLIDVKCSAQAQCSVVQGAARCVPVGDCYNGDSRCKDATTVEECQNNKWVATSCGAAKCSSKPGFPASCAQQEASSGMTLRGHLEYEFRKPNAALTDFSAELFTEAAVDFFVTVYEGSDLIGAGLTSPGGGAQKAGDWEVQLSKAVTPQSNVYFWPMLFDDSGNPRLAVAKAESDSASDQKSNNYWYWGTPACNSAPCGADTGTYTIRESEGSGAAHIYQWFDYSIFRMADLVPGVQPLTAAVFWEGGIDGKAPIKFDCGSCFAPPQMGGANVVYDASSGASDHYDASLNISGSSASPHHWSRATINHEIGHWIMQSYSRSPGEGGPHYVDQVSKPGLAYSEGFASFQGQATVSNSPSSNDSIGFRKSNGTTFWVDIGKVSWDGGSFELPNPNGPLDQDINENVVASMMWSLWAANNASKPQGLGDGPLYKVLPSKRLLDGPNRGYSRVDFVDYLDALRCGNLATAAQVTAVTSDLKFPYDNQPKCP
ncbi:MAG: hypothetical protein IT374_24415 [Polyangiaceae bacterium]|nr:hypothetical protein [Polyangiaceae bacterium]